MSAFALVTGTIFRAPTQKTAKSGKLFTTCTVKTDGDGASAAAPKPLAEPRKVLPSSNSGTAASSFSVEHQSMLFT